MTNFGRIDLRKMKAFLTGTTDTFDQKYGFSGAWPRQFIVIMDGNRYEGLWRDADDTDVNDESQGERRFFPIFCGQIEGETGSVRWTQNFKVDFTGFGARLWQMMKECEIWIEENGSNEYSALVRRATDMVKRFSKAEKDS